MNHIILKIVDNLTPKYKVFLIAGQEARDIQNKSNSDFNILEYSFENYTIMNNASLVITRAGASTLAEISALGKASILIPLPEAASDHQAANAKVYSSQNAAVV